MNVTPELVQKRLARFYALFHTNEHTQPEPTLWAAKVTTWSDIFRDTEQEVFITACIQCERQLKRPPCPADVIEQINTK